MYRTLLIFLMLVLPRLALASSTVPALPSATTLSGATWYIANGGASDNSGSFDTSAFCIPGGVLTLCTSGVTNAMLANSSMTIAGHSVSLGGTQAIAFADLSSTPTTIAGYGITDAAHNGANSDITSLSGLTTPLSVAQGGAGLATWTAAAIPLGNGTSPPNFLSEVDGDCVVGAGGAWTAATCDSASGGITALTGGVTASGPGSAVATVVTNANLTGPITSVGNATTFVGPFSGDCSNSGLALTCTKSSGTAFGTAAFDNTGTSGATIPLLNANNSWSAAQRGNTETPTIATTTFTPAGTAQNIRIDFPATTCTCTIANFSSIVAGQSGVIELVQGATSASLNPTWGSAYEYPGGTSTIVLTTTLGGIDYIPYYVESTGTYIVLGGIDLKPVH